MSPPAKVHARRPAPVVFGLGALLIVFTLYIPARQKLVKANAGIEYADAVARQLAGQRVQRIRNEGI